MTIGEGKFYSHGVGLDVVKSNTDFSAIMEELQELICRLVTFPLVTVAAINGRYLIDLCQHWHGELRAIYIYDLRR